MRLCVLASACTDAGSAILILQNQVPDAMCVASSSQTALFRTRGTMDLEAALGYQFFPLVMNVAEKLHDDPSSRIFQIRGADIAIEIEDGILADEADALVEDIRAKQNITQFFSGVVMPDGQTTAVSTVIVPRDLLDLIRATGKIDQPGTTTLLQVDVTLFGEMDGHTKQAELFRYPIELCGDCMVVNIGACTAIPDSYTALTGFACGQSGRQDVGLECCTSSTGAEVCPAAQETVDSGTT
jgi:hypothetical protein